MRAKILPCLIGNVTIIYYVNTDPASVSLCFPVKSYYPLHVMFIYKIGENDKLSVTD